MLTDNRKAAILEKLAAGNKHPGATKNRWQQTGKSSKSSSESVKTRANKGKVPSSSAITPAVVSVNSRSALTPGVHIPTIK